MFTKKWSILLALVVISTLVLAACQPQTVIVEKEVTKEVVKEVEKEVTKEVVKEVEKEVTKVVEKEVQVEVTPTPTPIPQGGFLNFSTFADADILNSLLSSDSSSSDFESYMFEAAFETDPWTGETIPGLVESWDVTDGNKTVVFHVRQGPKWTDGEPITAKDFKFMFDALMAVDDEGNPVLIESPRLDMVEYVETIELVDDYTLKVTYTEPICTNFEALSLAWLPSHVFLADPDFTFADLIEHPFNWEPTVFSGPFMFKEWVKDDHYTVVRNPDYYKGAPYLDGIVVRIVANTTVEKEMFKAGEIDLVGVDPKFLTELEQVPFADIYKFFRTAYDYIGLQQGDPTNPQPRLNDDGTVNEEHGEHPILIKKEVRQALVYAIDRNSIINKVRMGQAAPIEAHVIPTYGWAFNDELESRNYDTAKAAEMLDAAGWVLPEGAKYRVCQGCGTAPDGTPMKLNLKTNAGNEVREQIIQIAQQQWGLVGVEVEIEAMEWNAYLDVLLGQNFDAVCIGWTGVDPDNETLFFAKYDVPGGGFNFTSFYRPDYEPMELEAKTVEGCAYEDRGAIYKEIQEIFYDEVPYVFLYATRAITAINDRIGNVNPAPWSTLYNVHEWYIIGD
ncbi:MAG: hypothetical protein JW934_13115 [Anaerolineae bacterium]|nr:hypothetical protein [Anaerolineae bacterium]